MLTEECPECLGTGKATPECPECDGRGWVEDPLDGGTMTCPECFGVTECEFCNGTGEKTE